MTDLELIQFMYDIIEGDFVSGTTPSNEDFKILAKELFARGIIDDEDMLFSY